MKIFIENNFVDKLVYKVQYFGTNHEYCCLFLCGFHI
jgi:hypothetical protein